MKPRRRIGTDHAYRFAIRAIAFLLLGILVAETLALAAPDNNKVAASATQYSSLTYDMQVSYSYVYHSSYSDGSGVTITTTSQPKFTLLLDNPDVGPYYSGTGIQCSANPCATIQVAFSSAYTEVDPTGYCAGGVSISPGTYSLTSSGTYTLTVTLAAELSSTSGNTPTNVVLISYGSASNVVETLQGEHAQCFTGDTYWNTKFIPNFIASCFTPQYEFAMANAACYQFPIAGGSNTISPGGDAASESLTSVTGTAGLTLTSSKAATTQTSSSTTSTATTTTTSTTFTTTRFTGPQIVRCLLNQGAFVLKLVGVRTTPSTNNYVNTIFDDDTFFVDGTFLRPQDNGADIIPPGCQYSLSVTLTVTITGADGIPYQYGAPSSSPFTSIPTTWVALQPPTAPNQRPLGLWQAVATATITQSDAAGTIELGPISSLPLPFIVESHAPTGSIGVVDSKGNQVAIQTYGNITGNIPGNLQFTPGNGIPTLTFNVAGPTGKSGYLTMIVPKAVVGYGLTPAVLVNGIRLPFTLASVPATGGAGVSALFWQDAFNYYVRVQMHFSNDAVEVDFQPSAFSNGQSASLVIGQPDFHSKGYYVCKSCLAAPHGAAFASGNLWVVDSASNRVLRFSPPFSNGMEADLVIGHSDFGSTDSSTSQGGFWAPFAVAFDPSGNLWVGDYYNSRVLRFTPPFSDGMQASLVIGEPDFVSRSYSSTTPTGLDGPTAIAFDPSGNLWVADLARILRFSPPFSNGMAASIVIGQSDLTSYKSGTSKTLLSAPNGIAFDTSGNLWVSDYGNNRTLEYSTPFTNGMAASLVIGQASFTAGNTPTASPTTVGRPIGVAFDTYGDLWIADGLHNRALEFLPPFSTGMAASFVIGQKDFNSSASATSASGLSIISGGTPYFTGIIFDSAGNLLMVDSGNNRLLQFRANKSVTQVPEFPGNFMTVLTLCSALVTVAVLSSRRKHDREEDGRPQDLSG